MDRKGSFSSRRGPIAAWLVSAPSDLPEVLRARAVPVLMVPLTGPEIDGLAGSVISAEKDGQLAPLVASGLSSSQIARRLGTTSRTIERRIARMRDRLDVPSTPALIAVLAARGFGHAVDGGPAGAASDEGKEA